MSDFICKQCGLCCQWIAIPYKGVASADTLMWYKDRGIKIDSKHSIMWIPSLCPQLDTDILRGKYICKIHTTKNQICKKGNCQERRQSP